MNSRPTGTVTFLFTDIEGSTKLAQAHPDKWDALQQRHHAILQSAVESHNGYVFQIIGDAFCAAFHTAKAGINAAIEAQSKLQSEDWGDTPLKVRCFQSRCSATRTRATLHRMPPLNLSNTRANMC